MLKTLGKLKHIFKAGELTPLKKTQPRVNLVFRKMSSFFYAKRKQNQKKGLTKEQRIKLRIKRITSQKENKTYVNQKKNFSKEELLDMPEII